MRKLILFLVLLSGCGISPRSRINNQDGKIDELKNNQQGIMLELGKLQQQAHINDSKLDEVQQGWLNIQNQLSSNDNSGIQILQGDGALFMIFASIVIFVIYYFNNRYKKSEKLNMILSDVIRNSGDNNLYSSILEKGIEHNLEYELNKHFIHPDHNLE